MFFTGICLCVFTGRFEIACFVAVIMLFNSFIYNMFFVAVVVGVKIDSLDGQLARVFGQMLDNTRRV